MNVKPAPSAGSARLGSPKRRDAFEPDRGSLTDQILTLCISGRFGVREAIAEATRHQQVRERLPDDPNTKIWGEF
jgi:hypothetical protein